MATELEFCSNNIQFLLLTGIIFCISLFFFVELKKIKVQLSQIEAFINIPRVKEENTSFLSKLMNPLNKPNPPNLNNDLNPPNQIMRETSTNINNPLQPPTLNSPIEMKSTEIDPTSLSDIKQIKTNIREPEKETHIIVNKTDDHFDDLTDPDDHDDLTDQDDLDDLSDQDDLDDLTDLDDLSDVSIQNIEQNDTDNESLQEFDLDINIEELNKEITKQITEDNKDDDDDHEKEDEKEDVVDEDMSDKLKGMTVNELKTCLIEMKLPISGNKTKLITRIIENTQ